MIYSGRCHCGNIEVELETARAPAQMQVRACQCSLCRRHGGLTVSDPMGHVRLRAQDPEAVSPYRFGLRTSDFLLCGRCGVYVGAVTEVDGRTYAVVNIRTLEDASAFTSPPEPYSYDTETAEVRRARRAARWTPATLEGGLLSRLRRMDRHGIR
jgi:hypothetical protein